MSEKNRIDFLLTKIETTRKEIKDLREQVQYKEECINEYVHEYRKASVARVLEFIESEYRAGRICDLGTLLCHCVNKLYGNIDGVELDLKEGKYCKMKFGIDLAQPQEEQNNDE